MKLIVASIVVLSLVILFIFALFPADIAVSRIVRVETPKDSLFARVSDLRNWPRWNKLLPPGLKPVAATPDLLNYPDLKIGIERRSKDSVVSRWAGMHGKLFTGSFRFEQDGIYTVLQWSMQFHLKWYPWEKLSGMFYERRFGEAMDSSLLNLTQTRSHP